MLEYSKTVLQKVSFDATLFERELLKAIRSIVSEKIEEFKNWCYNKFGDVYSDILSRCFSQAI